MSLDEESARRRRVSYSQLEILWELLNSHKEVAVGYNKSSQAREHSKRVWMTITEILNSQGSGAVKDWKGWSNYWIDYKAKLKKKAAAIRNSMNRTGGGPSDTLPLTDVEKKFISLLGDGFGSGLPNIQVNPFPNLSQPAITSDVLLQPSASPSSFQVNPFPNLSQPASTSDVLLQPSASPSSLLHQPLPSTSNALEHPYASTGSALPPSPAPVPEYSIEVQAIDIDAGGISTQDDVAPQPGPIRRNRRRRTLTQEAAREHMVEGNKTRIQLEQHKIRILEEMLNVFKTYVAWITRTPEARDEGPPHS